MLASHRRLSIPLVSCLVVVLGAVLGGGPASAAEPEVSTVKINEIESNGDKVADWVELTNTGTTAVDISGWKILDSDKTHAPVVVPAGTSIAPGKFYAIYTEVDQTPGFGLGSGDSVTLYLPDGSTVVDSYEWTAHAATTYGRCPDGTGAFKTTTVSTRGAANSCSPVRLNEIESNDPASGPDWVELANISAAAVDLSGWVIKDSTEKGSYTFPAGSSIAANGYLTVDMGDPLAGLGSGDSVRLFAADGTTVVETYTWTTHAAETYGRCKDGLGDFVTTTTATKNAPNACPGLVTTPWPGSQTIRTADLAETFTQDLSGLTFDRSNPDVLWAAQNKAGTLFKLLRNGQNWVPDTANGWAAGKTPKYTDGTGSPDTEGLTTGPDGFVYASAERNNEASGVSRMSVLRYDPNASGTTLAATDEWNLTGTIPAAGANLGLEGITWVPDTFLVANGFVDKLTGAAYRPADYPLHGTGLYVVAVEDTGALHAFALDSTGGTSHLVATISSGFPHLADVTFDSERQRLWAVTDDTHDGKTSLLKITDGSFVVDAAYDRPASMANYNNEGFAIAPRSRCVDGSKEVLWSDDGDTGGHSLRAGTIACTPPVEQTVTFTSTPPVSPVVGQTYTVSATGGASGNPVVLTRSGNCSITGSTVTFDQTGACTITATQDAAPGYAAGSATQSFTVGKAATSTSVQVVSGEIVAIVSVTAPGAGIPGGSVEFRVGGTVVGTVALTNRWAALTTTVPDGADRKVEAIYSGDKSFAGSTASVVRRDPVITASVSSATPANGWYTSPVTISFSCTPQGAPLASDCPAPVTLDPDGADQSVSRTISALDGGSATATVTGIDIDRTAPVTRVTGVSQGRLYVGTKPSVQCAATDAVSGVASCIITKKVTPTRTTLVATATDRAGNTSSSAVTYRTLAYEIRGASYHGKAFSMKRGTSYRLVGTVKGSGRVYGPARLGTAAKAADRLKDGKATVSIPRSAKIGSTWKILIKQGSKSYTMKVRVTR